VQLRPREVRSLFADIVCARGCLPYLQTIVHMPFVV
jgi:hypothetical protein